MQVTVAASFFSASSLFWPIFSGLVGLAAVIVGFLSWRSNLPRRRILCNVISRTRLVTAPTSVRDDLEVKFQSKLLTNPYVVIAEVSNVGKRDISSASFTRDRGLAFQLTSPILKILTVEYEPTSAPTPQIIARDSSFELKPDLLVAGEIIKVSMLTEGPVGDISVSLNPLGDVKVSTRDREKWLQRRIIGGVAVFGILLIAVTVATGLYAAIDINNANTDYSQANADLSRANKTVKVIGCAGVVLSLQDASQSIGVLNALVMSFYKHGSSGLLPKSELRSEAHIAEVQASILSKAYSEARKAGVSVGTADRVVTDLQNARNSLLRLANDKKRTDVSTDIAVVSKAYKAVNGTEGFPHGCP